MGYPEYVNSLPLIPEWNEGKELGVVDLMSEEEAFKLSDVIEGDEELGVYYRLVKNSLMSVVQKKSGQPDKIEVVPRTVFKGMIMVLSKSANTRLLEKLNTILENK